MTSPVIALQKARSTASVLVVIPVLTLFVACTGSEGASAGEVENPTTWAPDKFISVQGVPATGVGNDLYHRDDKLVPVVMPGAWPSKEIVDAVQALRRIASA
ncbi:MAG TPA: hypothetical protein VF962_07465 [Gemmatimonadaceae bacterium]